MDETETGNLIREKCMSEILLPKLNLDLRSSLKQVDTYRRTQSTKLLHILKGKINHI